MIYGPPHPDENIREIKCGECGKEMTIDIYDDEPRICEECREKQKKNKK